MTPILSLLLAAAEPAPAGGSDPSTPTEAGLIIERLKQDIAQEEKAWAEETAREKQAEERRKKRHQEFDKDRREMQQTVAEQETRMKESMGRLESLGYREKELQARFRALNAVVAEEAKLLRGHLDAEIPYRLDKRREALSLLDRDVESGQISPEESSNRLWAFLQSERRLAQEAEVYSGDLVPEGATDPIQVKFLRVGKQVLAYASLDGSHLGILRNAPPVNAPAVKAAGSKAPADTAKTGHVWVRETEMDHATRKAIKDALATAEGISVPGFVPMPLWRASLGEAVP